MDKELETNTGLGLKQCFKVRNSVKMETFRYLETVDYPIQSPFSYKWTNECKTYSRRSPKPWFKAEELGSEVQLFHKRTGMLPFWYTLGFGFLCSPHCIFHLPLSSGSYKIEKERNLEKKTQDKMRNLKSLHLKLAESSKCIIMARQVTQVRVPPRLLCFGHFIK